MNRKKNSVFILMNLFFVLSCHEMQPVSPPVVWEGKYFVLRTYAPLYIENSMFKTDEAIEKIHKALDLPLLEKNKINYFYHEYRNDDSFFPCSGDAAACFVKENNSVHSSEFIHVHELVHAVMELHYSFLSHPIFEEGFAEYFAGILYHYNFSIQYPTSIDISMQMNEYFRPYLSPFDLDYQLAAYFVEFIINEYGLDSAKEMYSQAYVGFTKKKFDVLFEKYTGHLTDEIIEKFSQSFDPVPETVFFDNCLLSEPLPQTDGNWFFKGEISKKSSDIYQISASDFTGSGTWFLAEKQLFIEKPGRYKIEISQPQIFEHMNNYSTILLSPQIIPCNYKITTFEEYEKNVFINLQKTANSSITAMPDGATRIQNDEYEVFFARAGTYVVRLTGSLSTQYDLLNINSYFEVKITKAKEENDE